MTLRIENLTRLYGTQRAISNLNFAVNPGEIVGFLGPNGAGKSTTMKIITCFLPPTEGTVHLGQYRMDTHAREIRRRIGYLPELNPLYLDMYVHEFLRFVGRLYGLSRKHLRQRVPEIVAQTGLEPEQHKKIGMLSKGYRQRVGVAQALIHDPDVLILDEPTSGLDPNQVLDIRQLITEIGREKTVLFSSHILSEVEAIAGRVIIIHRGQIMADTPIGEVHQLTDQTEALHIEVERPGLDLQPLETHTGILRVEPLSPTQFRLHTRGGTDLRKFVSEEIVRQEHTLLSLSREAAQLEDVFRQLTRNPTSPETDTGQPAGSTPG